MRNLFLILSLALLTTCHMPTRAEQSLNMIKICCKVYSDGSNVPFIIYEVELQALINCGKLPKRGQRFACANRISKPKAIPYHDYNKFNI